MPMMRRSTRSTTPAPRGRVPEGLLAKTTSMPLDGPGRVNTPKGRSRRGIEFYRPRFSEPSYSSLPGDWRQGKEIVLLVLPAQTFLHGQDPFPTLGTQTDRTAAIVSV